VTAAVRGGATGMLVTATGPVTATVRSDVGGDLSHAVPGDDLSGSSTALLPPGGRGVAKSVQLAGATRSGVVVVVARSAAGAVLDRTRTEVAPDRGVTVRLPRDAALVSVTPSRTTVSGAVLITGGGAAVLPLRLPVLSGLVPAVRPGIP
jgi:hypothetical protein